MGALLFCAASAPAAPLPLGNLAALAPVAETVYAPTYTGTTFSAEFQSSTTLPLDSLVKIELSSEPTLGQDGTLADDKRVGIGSLTRRDSDPSKWVGSYSSLLFRYPGHQYYFQFSASVYQPSFDTAHSCLDVPLGQSGRCSYASPVLSFRVEQPQAQAPSQVQAEPQAPSTPTSARPLLSKTSATSSARRYAIRRLRAKNVRLLCRRVDRSTFECRVTWRKNGHRRNRVVEVYREAGHNYVQLIG